MPGPILRGPCVDVLVVQKSDAPAPVGPQMNLATDLDLKITDHTDHFNPGSQRKVCMSEQKEGLRTSVPRSEVFPFLSSKLAEESKTASRQPHTEETDAELKESDAELKQKILNNRC